MSRPRLSSLDDRSVTIWQGCSVGSSHQVRAMSQGENIASLTRATCRILRGSRNLPLTIMHGAQLSVRYALIPSKYTTHRGQMYLTNRYKHLVPFKLFFGTHLMHDLASVISYSTCPKTKYPSLHICAGVFIYFYIYI